MTALPEPIRAPLIRTPLIRTPPIRATLIRAMVDGVMTTDPPTVAVVEARGDGALETIGVWDGRPFRLADHLARLSSSLQALALPPVPTKTVAEEVDALLDGTNGDGALRIYCLADGRRILTLHPIPQQKEPEVLIPQPAPWIQPIEGGQGAAPKSLSYAANLAARRRAIAAGGDDALLIAVPGDWVLEGPTWGVVMVIDDVVCVPAPHLGIVQSVSAMTIVDIAVDAGIAVAYGRWTVATAARAQELIATSSLRPPTAVRQVGTVRMPDRHPLTNRFRAEVDRARRGR